MTGKGILIVEDENIVALDMKMRLEAMGYRVLDLVDTASRAIERATELSPDLVLMDIKLKGGVDGIDAARQLRERTRVPVIFVTAFTDEKTLGRAKGASPYGYIVKPFHERELRIAIELALYKHQYELSMIRAKELAEEANRLKGAFLANMSHELKTPLNSVIGFTELAMDKAVDGEQRELLAMALGSSKSLLTLIDSILDYTRMEAGKAETVSAPFSLSATMGDCVDALAVEAHAKGLEASYLCEAGLPDSLLGDAGLLRHAILNLIDNSVKFTDRGWVSLAVRGAAEPAGLPGRAFPQEGTRTLVFTVADTGIGMDPEKIDSAFERFTQLDSSTTRRAGGTGLGLAIVQRNVELLGGTIAVDSAPGAGTRIELRLPFDPGPAGPGLPSPLAGKTLILAGFDERLEPELREAAAALGGSARVAGGPDRDLASLASLAREGELVLADERLFVDADCGAAPGSLAGRVVIATRFGSGLRSRLSACEGLAFVPMPVRADRLAVALADLSRPASGARWPEPGRPAAPNAAAPKAAAAPPSEEATRALGSLARLLEGFSDEAGLEEAERGIKEGRDRLVEEGQEEGAKLALSALLLARKGDAAGLRALAGRVRALAGRSLGEGPEDRTEKAGR